ncbi:MAG: phosphatidate cytidylyltransferase [Planctomycetaceae bacterium]|nr:phosphatidate cytidylyltransferase [Planctomycetaceae bacterium]
MSTTPEPDVPKKNRSTRNLILRGMSALGVLIILYLCMRWDTVHASGWAWAGITAVGSVFMLREFFRLAVESEFRPFSWLVFITGPLYILAIEWELSGDSLAFISWSPTNVVLLFTIVGTMLLQLTRRSTDNALSDVGVTILGFLYCVVLPGVLIHVRHLTLTRYGWPMDGVEFVIVCIFVGKVSDVGALLTGSQWGKHKLIPRLSPGKTWEGAVGGTLFSVFLLQFMALTNLMMALHVLGHGWMVVLSLLLAAGSLAGDLIESAFKRNSRRKDAGTGVPGFGGVLDLTDSLLVAGPVLYFFLVLMGAEYVKS